MKKSVIILVLLVFISAGAFSQGISLSIGGGGLFDWGFNNGFKWESGGNDNYWGMRNASFGGFFFFDATYVELEAAVAYGLLTSVSEVSGSSETEKAGSMLQAGISVLGKYPFDFEKLTFFPLIGVSYNMVLMAKDNDGKKYFDSASDTIKEFSQFGLLGGVGFDIGLKGSLFLRLEALYHLRFSSKNMKDEADLKPDAMATLGMGPRVKVGVGYKIK